MTGKEKHSIHKTFARNRRALFDYEIMERVECGFVLDGWEVKSIRAGKVNLTGSYILLRRNEAWIIGMTITPLLSTHSGIAPLDDQRTRKLLMAKSQLRQYTRQIKSGSLACVPLDIHEGRSHFIKLMVGIGRGRKKYDKRELIKEQDWKRRKDKLLKRGRT